MQGRRIIDAVTHEADGMAPPLQSTHDPLLLLRIDLDEEVRGLGQMPQGLVLDAVELGTGEHALGIEPDGFRDMGCHEAVVAGDDLDGDAEPCQVADGVPDALLQRIKEQEKADENHTGLVRPIVMRSGRHSPRRKAEHPIPLSTLARIEAGDRVPADGTLAFGQGVATDDSIITGESLPSTRTVGRSSSAAPSSSGARDTSRRGAPALPALRALLGLVSLGAGTLVAVMLAALLTWALAELTCRCMIEA